MNPPCELTAGEALRLMADDRLDSEALAVSCLERIDRLEPAVGAWAHLSPEHLLAQARQADQRRREGQAAGLVLNGIPVGVKDIFDTCDLPTENGTSVDHGRQPATDARVVELLRAAGALIAGKTVTAELAVYAPGKTTNPHDHSRTPGGSSSGSAAAVACSMVPLAIGTQTNGSVIRPASYCGVVGYKPTGGLLARAGILCQAPSLDQVGVFSRRVFDSALLVSALTDRSRLHGDTQPWSPPDLARLHNGSAAPPRLALARTAVWPEASKTTREAILTGITTLGVDIEEIVLPDIAGRAVGCHRTIMLAEMAYHYWHFYDHHHLQISPQLLAMIEEGQAIGLAIYLEARELAAEITDAVEQALAGFDGVLTPATPTPAPRGLASTGSPIFCTLWSLCGVPALSLPLLTGEDDLPLGLQIVAPRGMDSRLLQAAQWLEEAGPTDQS
ncbi:amidase [Desulfofustis glycolicus]|uniref:Asp-tRNAAsn/Glu-tRNAGln amidotransferase A subunit n=1 Tax=Desulfofustis glycolicus DSM 9705 TaxID=1121409 RepID=A0A1M5T997_9BACT|nr:amidase [Desulfofustis glycolicus]MCB2215428.1 amidase [Desulfobulbaceae bacterium]SHH47284.1 Asp-tRNAAsn/Glu-tRNAGln amidotransferase A subunit [Desulfofustis glycolicus DSM 9705]